MTLKTALTYIFIFIRPNQSLRYAEFREATLETLFKSGLNLRKIDRGGLCARLARRERDYIAYVRSVTGVVDLMTVEETYSHLEWLTIDQPGPQLYWDMDSSVSSICTDSDYEQEVPRVLPR